MFAAIAVLGLFGSAVSAQPIASCLSDSDVEAVVAPQANGGAFSINTSAIYGRSLCTGIPLADKVQEIVARYRPQAIVKVPERSFNQGELPREAFSTDHGNDGGLAGRNALTEHLEADNEAEEDMASEYPEAGAKLTRQLDGFVRKDSRGWAFNRYVPGSMRNVKIVSGSTNNGHFVMQGQYTYNGNLLGSVRAAMTNGKLNCIEFHDAVMGCRNLRTPEQGQAMRDVAVGAISGALDPRDSGASQDTSGVDAQKLQDYHNRMRDQAMGRPTQD